MAHRKRTKRGSRPQTQHPRSAHKQDVSEGRRIPLTALAAVSIVLAYGCTFASLPPDGFWINDNGCKFIILEGLILSDYSDFAIPWDGQALDPEFRYNPLRPPFGRVQDGKLYCQYSPVFALISSFPYRLLGYYGLYVIPLAGGLLALPAVWMLAGLVSGDRPSRRIARPLALVLAALCTPLWFYSMTFWEHTAALCLAMWAVLLCVRHVVRGGLVSAGLSAICCGLSVYLRDDLYILAAVITAVFFFSSPSRWFASSAFCVIFVLTVAPLWIFQSAALGSALGHHITQHGGGLAEYVSGRWTVLRNLIINCHSNLALSLPISMFCAALWIWFPRLRDATFRWVVWLLAVLASIGGVVILSGHITAASPVRWLLNANGLFAATPILVLALLRRANEDVPRREREARDRQSRVQRILWWIMSSFVILYVLIMPAGASAGIHWGCRFLMPVFPLLAVLAAVVIAEWWHLHHDRPAPGKALIVLAVVFSIGFQVYPLQLLHGRKQYSSHLNQAVAQRPQSVVVVRGGRGWFVPQELFQVFYDKTIFFTGNRGYPGLTSMLKNAGLSEFLLISYPPATEAIGTNREVLSDGPLKFMTVSLHGVRLDD